MHAGCHLIKREQIGTHARTRGEVHNNTDIPRVSTALWLKAKAAGPGTPGAALRRPGGRPGEGEASLRRQGRPGEGETGRRAQRLRREEWREPGQLKGGLPDRREG